ncbi:hypothetical protein EJB05_15191, partial [Eragrostis curvula]
MSLSVDRLRGDVIAGKEDPAGTQDSSTRRHRPLASASATSSSAASSRPQWSSTWQPLPRPVPRRRRVGTTTASPADAAVVSASARTRVTWPPARTPRRGLVVGGDALSLPSPKPSGPTRGESTWLGSLRSGPQPQVPPQRGVAGTDAPPSSPTSAARASSPRRSVGFDASAARAATRSASPPASPGSQPPASATASSGTPLPPIKPATASRSAPLPPPTKPAPAPGRSHRAARTKLPTGSTGALPPPPPPPPPTKPNPGASHPSQINMATLTSGALPLPPHLAVFGQRIIEVLFNLNYGHLGYAGVVLLGVYAGLKELLSGWNALLKVSYILLLILGAASLGAGLMAATSIAPTGYTHRVSSVCSRLCTCLATFVFIVALACHMGSDGYIAGIILGVVAVCYIVSVWLMGDPAAYREFIRIQTSIKYLWQRYKWCGQRGRILP